MVQKWHGSNCPNELINASVTLKKKICQYRLTRLNTSDFTALLHLILFYLIFIFD